MPIFSILGVTPAAESTISQAISEIFPVFLSLTFTNTSFPFVSTDSTEVFPRTLIPFLVYILEIYFEISASSRGSIPCSRNSTNVTSVPMV